MDDFEREMMIVELSEEWDELVGELEQADKAKPDWWLIALGAKDATREVYDKSVDIYQKFKRFEPAVYAKDFNTAVDLFTAAMIQNRI